MKNEHPILFRGEMVRAILEGRKTMTRRIVKDKYQSKIVHVYFDGDNDLRIIDKSETDIFMEYPYGYIGDKLWVRETWRQAFSKTLHSDGIIYKADKEKALGMVEYCGKWKPSIFMPRWASRITLEIIGVSVERVQDITEEAAKAEGMLFHNGNGIGHSGYRHDVNHGYVYDTAKKAFEFLWNSINGNWNENPWVWVIQFKRLINIVNNS